jgi:pyruvate/2-oxoglutarate dehydrogenase complex dihydrolipoamide acyltransferase (E2) component
MAPEQRGTEKPDHTRLSIWLTFIGTILAALIAGIFALLTADHGDKPAAAPTTAGQPPAATTAAATPTAAPRSSPAATTAAAGAPVAWSGRVTVKYLAADETVDLDQVPARSAGNSSGAGDVAVTIVGEAQTDLWRPSFANSRLAPWSGDGTPEFAQCRDAALAEGVEEVKAVREHAVLCVHTTEDRTARLTVRAIDAKQGTVRFDALVWQEKSH